jgi:hypothetical protein
VTWRGETFAGRVAASLLHAVGLPELVADDVEGYVRTATALAGDPAERARLRQWLEGPGRQSALFDTTATTRALEAAYQAMAEQYRHRTRAPDPDRARSLKRYSRIASSASSTRLTAMTFTFSMACLGLFAAGMRDRAIAELGGLANPLLPALDRADFPGESHFTEHEKFGGQRLVA